MLYATIASRLPFELRHQVDCALEPADAAAMLQVSKKLNALTKESPTLLLKMLDEQGIRCKSMADQQSVLEEKLQQMHMNQSGLLSSLVRSEHENALHSIREEKMSDSVGQLLTVRRELEDERVEKSRQASMNAMLMEDLRLRSWQEAGRTSWSPRPGPERASSLRAQGADEMARLQLLAAVASRRLAQCWPKWV